jgi:hypothetical protein
LYGRSLEQGTGISIDLGLAAEHDQKSADQGNPSVHFNYDLCFEDRKCGSIDLPLAA